jgi:hypothetical protein
MLPAAVCCWLQAANADAHHAEAQLVCCLLVGADALLPVESHPTAGQQGSSGAHLRQLATKREMG